MTVLIAQKMVHVLFIQGASQSPYLNMKNKHFKINGWSYACSGELSGVVTMETGPCYFHTPLLYYKY